MCTREHYRFQAKHFLDFQISGLSMKEFTKDVHKERMKIRHFQAVKVKIKEYCRLRYMRAHVFQLTKRVCVLCFLYK